MVIVCIVMWYFYAAALSVFKGVLHTDESVGVESSHDIQWNTSLCKFMHHVIMMPGDAFIIIVHILVLAGELLVVEWSKMDKGNNKRR